MKIKRQKKGFTIVELVIVIAVIGVLAAVLIPTFAGLVRKANVAADTALVKDLNTALTIDKGLNGKHATMYDALEATKESGLDVSKLNAKIAKNEIMWDSANDVFCYLDDGEIKYVPDTELEVKAKNVKAYQYFVIRDVDSADDISGEYSTYLRSSTLTEIETTKGLDVGEVETITKVTYTNTGDAQNVVIRTNGGELVVNAPNDTVNHYGYTDDVNITEVASNSYDEFGIAKYIEIQKGHLVVKSGATVNVILTTGSAKIDKENQAIVGNSYTTIENNNHGGNVTLEKIDETQKETIKESSAFVGKGTANAPYQIYNVNDLITLSSKVADGNSYEAQYFELVNDIDMKGVLWGAENGEDTIYCIGTSETPFSGNFFGNNHSILNLSNGNRNSADDYTAPSSGTVGGIFGLFGYVKGNITIKNLTVNVDANVQGSEGTAGLIAIVAKAEENTNYTVNITDVKITGNIVADEKTAGFIYASSDNKNAHIYNFTNCINEANSISSSKPSGFFSQPQNYETINFVNCQNEGKVAIPRDENNSYASYSGYGTAAGFIANVQGATVNYDVNSVNNGIVDAPLAADYHTFIALKMSQGSWKYHSGNYEQIWRSKGVYMTETAKAYADFAEDYLGLPNAFDGLLYETNNEYVISFSSSNSPNGLIRYTMEEWTNDETDMSFASKNTTTPLVVTLYEDLTWTRAFEISGSGRPIVIDLNGHTLTVEETMFTSVSYSFIVKNGILNKGSEFTGDVLKMGTSGTITYENVTGNYNV